MSVIDLDSHSSAANVDPDLFGFFLPNADFEKIIPKTYVET